MARVCYNFRMQYSKHVETIFLAAILGLAGFAVTFLGSMSENIQKLSVSVQELNGQMAYFKETLKDHEERIRHAETKRR